MIASSADLAWQGSLFGLDEPGFDASFSTVERTRLDASSWVDHAPFWLAGADAVFAELSGTLSWRQREVKMYERLLPEPRLTARCDGSDDATEPMPVLAGIRAALSTRYARPFDTIGFNLYRDGRDSVAWHGDRERYRHEDPVVAIVSVGARRGFHLRRRGGGRSLVYRIGHGDLLVMGGACQHDWEHSVPKVAGAQGPRLSIMFRHNLASPPSRHGVPTTSSG